MPNPTLDGKHKPEEAEGLWNWGPKVVSWECERHLKNKEFCESLHAEPHITRHIFLIPLILQPSFCLKAGDYKVSFVKLIDPREMTIRQWPSGPSNAKTRNQPEGHSLVKHITATSHLRVQSSFKGLIIRCEWTVMNRQTSEDEL